MKPRDILLILLSLVAAFFAGAAWKSQDSKDQRDAEERSEIVTRVRQEEPAAIPVNAEQSQADSADFAQLAMMERATIDLFENAAPSVVFITAISIQQNYRTRSVYEIPRGSGSGFIWDKEGHIVTNFHVVRGGQKIKVTLADQSTWDAKVVGISPEKDLAVIKIDAEPGRLRPIKVGNSESLMVGQNVYAIGNPFGLDQTLTTGVISALGREIESLSRVPIRDVIQTDAAINPGNSGGPLLNSSGQLIGVNTQIYSPSGASAGIGFSIPVDAVKWVVPDLIEFGEIRRPLIGIALVNQGQMRRLGLEGALVLNITPGTGAERAGLQPTRRNRFGDIELGDLIVGINGEVVKTNNDLLLALEKYETGDVVRLEVRRADEIVEIPVTLSPNDD